MTSKKPTDLDDIAEAIQGLATHMDERFEQVDKRFERVDKRFESIEDELNGVKIEVIGVKSELNGVKSEVIGVKSELNGVKQEVRTMTEQQRQMRDWLERIDGRLFGVENDIKEVYDLIVDLEKRFPNITKKEQNDLQHSLSRIMSWANEVSVKTGIPLPKK